MNHVVLDASVCLNWFLPSDKPEPIRYSKAFAEFIKGQPVTLHVPVHFDLEITGPLLKSMRSENGITEKAFNAAMQAMDALPLNFHELGLGFKKNL